MPSSGTDSPPGLSHSLPTSATYSVTPRTRAPSVESPYSPGYDDFDFSQPPEHFDIYHQQHIYSPPSDSNEIFQSFPYEVDIKTEREMFVNDIPTRKDSSMSTFSTYHPPQGVTPFVEEEWIHRDVYDNNDIFGADDGPELDVIARQPELAEQSVQIEVEECDNHLLDHFITNVSRLLFPILDVNKPGLARGNVILPTLASNKCYLHCCLGIAATHLKTTRRLEDNQIDEDIMRHRVASVTELCAALNRDTDHQQILEATLGTMFFQCSVGRPVSALEDIAWFHHLDAASKLVKKLQMQHEMEPFGGPDPVSPFNMTLTSWIDILGATMLGLNPIFADTYRHKNMSRSASGLREMMGCEDEVMYMISEIACLDSIKTSGTLDDFVICQHIESLGQHMSSMEPQPYQLQHPKNSAGALNPQVLTDNITALFRVAARIYLCSLVPGQSALEPPMVDLVSRLAGILEFIPAGVDGFDRSLVWPLLIGGSMSTSQSDFRRLLEDRIAQLGENAELGSFGRMVHLLREVWRQSDEHIRAGGTQNVHWRSVMQQQGWDYLLI